MRAPVNHPVFGLTVRDQWGSGLLTFRQFPHMKAFWHPDPEGTIGRLSPKQRDWVKN